MLFKNHKNITRCAEGVTMIEFAIIAPVMFLLLIGFIELSLIFTTYLVLEGATTVGSRIGRTGYTESGSSREDYIRSEIIRLSAGLIDSRRIVIQELAYDNFNNIGKPEPCTTPGDTAPCPNGYVDVNHNGQWDADQGVENAGGRSDVVLYRVSYPWTVFTPLMNIIIGDVSGQITITATATVKNERF